MQAENSENQLQHPHCSKRIELHTKLNDTERRTDTLTRVNTNCCGSVFPVGVCYSSIITCLQIVLGLKSGQRRKRRENTHLHTHTCTHTHRHLTARDYGCSYSSSHCGSTTGRVWGGKQACTSQDEEWTRFVEGQVPCGRGCAGTQMGTPGKNLWD